MDIPSACLLFVLVEIIVHLTICTLNLTEEVVFGSSFFPGKIEKLKVLKTLQ